MLGLQAGIRRTANVPPALVHRSRAASRAPEYAHAKIRSVVAHSTVKEDLLDPPFNLDKAVVLGAAAFGAYIEPAKSQGLVKQKLNGTKMRFFDSKFVQEGYEGVLEFSAISAKNVPDSDNVSKSDVYITAELGDAYARTSTKFNNQDPVFDQTLDIWVPKGKAMDEITIRVFDDDHMGNEDDHLGSATFKLKSLREESNTVELKMRGENAGDNCYVTLTATFLPFGGTAGDQFLETVDAAIATQISLDAPLAIRNMEKAVSAVGEPLSEDLLKAWNEICSLYDKSLFTDKRTIAFIDNRKTGTQAWISRDVAERKVIVSFRGTEPTNKNENFADVFIDVDLRQTPMDLREAPDMNSWNKFLRTGRLHLFRNAGPKVHSGFHRSWVSVRETVLQTIDDCTDGAEDWHIYVTGHSLGGALAILCAFELGQREKPEPKYPITMYNYGGPRVGNQNFVDLYNVKDSWRVHNENDIVAQVPIAGFLGYKHIETGVRMLEDGSGFKFTNALNEDVEIQGGPDAKWSARNILTEIREEYDDYSELISKQRDTYNALTSGEAVAAHLEDYYCEGLTFCVEDSDDSKLVAEVTQRAKDFVKASRAKSAEEAEATA